MAAYDATKFPQKPTACTFKDREGQRYGRLTAVTFGGDRGGIRHWICRCDCGRWRVVISRHLTSGAIQTCGCSRGNTTRIGKLSRRAWQSMKSRCLKPERKDYKDYGARGISICDRWMDFENFFADMGGPPTTRHSLERIDNSRGYGPDNCKWATRKEQNRNKRSNRLLSYDGKTQCLSAWSDEYGIGTSTIMKRIKLGWTVDRALSQKVRGS